MAAFTRQCFFMNMVTIVFIFTEEVQRLHDRFLSFYQWKLIMHMECGRAIFGKPSNALKVQRDAPYKMRLHVDTM